VSLVLQGQKEKAKRGSSQKRENPGARGGRGEGLPVKPQEHLLQGGAMSDHMGAIVRRGGPVKDDQGDNSNVGGKKKISQPRKVLKKSSSGSGHLVPKR